MEPIERHFVSLPSPTAARNGAGYMPTQGIYHRAKGSAPRTAIIATHYNVDFSEHYMAELMAARGYGFLGWNTRFRGLEHAFSLDHALIDIGVGLRWLREEAGVERVVLLGNSGGGSLMAAYQSQAVEPNLKPLLGRAVPEAALRLPPADLYVSTNAHPGRPEVLTDWFDPSVTDEADPTSVDPALDMYDPENGPPYSEAFIERYRAAQVARNQRITAWALSELERVQGAGCIDRMFNLYRTWADPRLLDGRLDPNDREIGVCYLGPPKLFNYSPYGIGSSNTIRTWLSMWSLEYSQCRAIPHLERIDLPSLVVQSMADTGVFPVDAQVIHDNLAAEDKSLEFIPGDHYLQEPAGARDQVADLVAAWLGERGA
ncbi:MAG: alpha/beta hydrolase [Deltaproteobacteria bacterium]|jgi:pimeloyl-ACP methyl ester carboxylesterase|nr:alpha/beta hydrolase [Deltaproteobacteria bacterium]